MTSEPISLSTPQPAPSYGSYLRLPEILNAQSPLSGAHDEMLFIIIHQASELWIKLCLHEIDAARTHLRENEVPTALKMLARVVRALEQLIQSWSVLATITPPEYSSMRAALGGSSGFQSVQYRMMEFALGNKDPRMIGVHASDPGCQALLTEALVRPSLYDESIALLARLGFDIPLEVLERDVTKGYVASHSVEAAWEQVYRQPDRYWDLYELAEKLVDLESRFQTWRFGHLKTVERIIGFKRGTGGTAGVSYLAAVIEKTFFPELLNVRLAL